MTVSEVATEEEEEQEQEEKESAECKPKNKNRTEWSGETAKSPVKSKPTSEISCYSVNVCFITVQEAQLCTCAVEFSTRDACDVRWKHTFVWFVKAIG